MKIYHAKYTAIKSFENYSYCNKKRQTGWNKYNMANFKRGKILNLSLGKEIKIPGRPCKKCNSLIIH